MVFAIAGRRFRARFWLVVLIVQLSTFVWSKAQTTASGSVAAYQRGQAAMEKGDAAGARSAFQQAIKLDPRNADAQNALGQLMLQQGDVDGAIEHFRVVTRLRPGLAIAHAYLAQALSAKGSLDEAAHELRIAVRLAPQQADAHVALARVLSQQQKTDDAISEMKKAVVLQPARADLHDDLGVLLAQQLQLQDAEKEFRAALHSDQKYEPAQMHLGVALLNGGERDEGIAALQQAAQLDPEDGTAKILPGHRTRGKRGQ